MLREELLSAAKNENANEDLIVQASKFQTEHLPFASAVFIILPQYNFHNEHIEHTYLPSGSCPVNRFYEYTCNYIYLEGFGFGLPNDFVRDFRHFIQDALAMLKSIFAWHYHSQVDRTAQQ